MLADEVRALADEGLQWSADEPYHRDRYERLRHIAAKAFAIVDRRGIDEIEREVLPLLTYPAPIPTVDAAIVDEDGRILLIQRADDELWAMPGGGTHLGETLAEGACREALEEAGAVVDVVDFIGVYDSRSCGASSPQHLAMVTFLCEPVAMVEATTPQEVLAAGWFAEEALPPLSPGHTVRVPDVFRFLRDRRVAFDGGAITHRHPAVEALIAAHEPIGSHPITVWGGDTRLQLHAYAGTADLPDELVLSIRCLVVVPSPEGARLVLCESVDGDTHPWPGGRREAGETYADTLVREVHEETGWRVDPATIRQLGWLRYELFSPRPAVSKGPHPDFLQVVCTAVATERDGGHDADWTDVMGQELSSFLVPLADGEAALTDPVARAFVHMAQAVHA